MVARSANPLRVSDSSALHCEIASSGTWSSSCKPVVLVTIGVCHLLDGLLVVSIKACKKLVRYSGEVIVRGVVLPPQEPQRATVVEHVIERPSLGSWGSCGAQCVGLVWCQLAAERPSERLTQQGLACWQACEPWEKNHRVNLVLPIGLHPRYTS